MVAIVSNATVKAWIFPPWLNTQLALTCDLGNWAPESGCYHLTIKRFSRVGTTCWCSIQRRHWRRRIDVVTQDRAWSRLDNDQITFVHCVLHCFDWKYDIFRVFSLLFARIFYNARVLGQLCNVYRREFLAHWNIFMSLLLGALSLCEHSRTAVTGTHLVRRYTPVFQRILTCRTHWAWIQMCWKWFQTCLEKLHRQHWCYRLHSYLLYCATARRWSKVERHSSLHS